MADRGSMKETLILLNLAYGFGIIKTYTNWIRKVNGKNGMWHANISMVCRGTRLGHFNLEALSNTEAARQWTGLLGNGLMDTLVQAIALIEFSIL